MKLRFEKSVLKGEISAPPSKSESHRILISAALFGKGTKIFGLEMSDDISATVSALRSLGAIIRQDEGYVTVESTVYPECCERVINCRESASTLRFLIPVAAAIGGEYVFMGCGRLLERPIDAYDDILNRNGIFFSHNREKIILRGKLRCGNYKICAEMSSQFVSGMLFAMAYMNGDSSLTVDGELNGRSYVEMTVNVLERFSRNIECTEKSFRVGMSNDVSALELTPEGDYSNSAFFEAFNYIGGHVDVQGLNENSIQGDKAYKIFFPMIKKGSCLIDISDTPDLAPVYMALGALCDGVVLDGTKRLGVKESDRGSAMARELSKFGIRCECSYNRITVCGGCISAPAQSVSSHNDHRIAMALSVILLSVGGELEGCEAVAKSMPRFFNMLTELGAELRCV